ncbi:MAG: hypothetical protein Q9174_006777, partial [Haloplaca sp. 1 TL-2023]
MCTFKLLYALLVLALATASSSYPFCSLNHFGALSTPACVQVASIFADSSDDTFQPFVQEELTTTPDGSWPGISNPYKIKGVQLPRIWSKGGCNIVLTSFTPMLQSQSEAALNDTAPTSVGGSTERDPTIGLCRAIKVDATQLGAHLEAYARSKGPTTCFRACVRHAAYNTPLSKVPNEISSLIQGALHEELYYNDRIVKWHEAMNCIKNTYGHRNVCRRNHQGKKEHTEYDVTDNSPAEDKTAPDSNEVFTPEPLKQHYDFIASFVTNLTACIDKRPFQLFTKYRRLFCEDFNIRIEFHGLKHYDEANELAWVDVDAYLVQSLIDTPVSWEPGPGEAYFTVKSGIIEPMVVDELDADYEPRFRKAMQALKLEAPHRYRPLVKKIKGRKQEE